MAVNLSPLAGAGAQFFDDNGVPLTAGLLYSYQAGSSTPQPTYTSSSGVTLHSNPIVLDSAGRVPGGEIWLTDGVAYKFVLHDADDVLIATYDNIPSISTTIDAANVNYTAPFNSAVQETVEAKLAQTVSVLDFGAVGNGIADDTVAIQNAIDELGEGILYFPAGTYKVTAGLTVNASMVLMGDSPNSSLLKPYGNIDVVTFGGNSQGAGIQNLGFTASNASGGACIVVNTANRLGFTNLLMQSPWEVFRIIKCNVCSIRQVWANSIRGSYGIKWYGDNSNRSDVLDIDNVQFSGSQSPATATSPIGLLIDGNVATCDLRHFAMVNGRHGILIENLANVTPPAFITGYDIQIDYPYSDGIKAYASYNVIRSLMFTDLYINGSLAGAGVYLDSTVEHASIQGAKISGNYTYGIYANSRYTHIANCNISTNSLAGSALYPGVLIGGNSIGVSMTGCLSGQWVGYAAELQSYGVQINAGAQSYNVVGNNLRLNVTAAYLDNANDSTSVIFSNNATSTTYQRIPNKTAAMTGDLELYGAGTNSVVMGNETNGIGFVANAAGTNSINYIKAFGTATGVPPAIQAIGGDTNVDLELRAWGAGYLKYYRTATTGIADQPVTGYIEIKDDTGTVRKLAIIS